MSVHPAQPYDQPAPTGSLRDQLQEIAKSLTAKRQQLQMRLQDTTATQEHLTAELYLLNPCLDAIIQTLETASQPQDATFVSSTLTGMGRPY